MEWFNDEAIELLDTMSDGKECFFITPIGEEESETRNRSNKVMNHIIQEGISEFGYTVERADLLDEPGSITRQIIQKTINSELVVADLTDHNPNVFYELAVRHATGEPYIQLIQSSESIPFDISDFRTIKYGLDVEEADQARQEIQSMVKTLEEGDSEFDNPISWSAKMQSLQESDSSVDQNIVNILDKISNIDRKVERIESNLETSGNITISEETELPRHHITFGDKDVLIRGNALTQEDISRIAESINKSEDELMTYFENHPSNISIE